jgi:octanoyl-[GcvH]:protein N-octanoyltransferase
MELLRPDGFESATTAYGYTRTIFEEIASGGRPAVFSISPSVRHVGVTKKDTHRPGFGEAVRLANGEGYPVLVRGAGGGAIAAGAGTFGFSIIRPAGGEDPRAGIGGRYDEAVSLALAALLRLGVRAEVGEVRDEFCPGDRSLRVGGFEGGMKLVGIAQRVTRWAASVGGIVLVSGEGELARVLELFYGAIGLSFRPGSVGSLRRAGSEATVREAMDAFAEEAIHRYGAEPIPLDGRTLKKARWLGSDALVRPAG